MYTIKSSSDAKSEIEHGLADFEVMTRAEVKSFVETRMTKLKRVLQSYSIKADELPFEETI